MKVSVRCQRKHGTMYRKGEYFYCDSCVQYVSVIRLLKGANATRSRFTRITSDKSKYVFLRIVKGEYERS